MDRNEQFRKRLESRLSQSINRDGIGQHRIFDPTPYVNIIMENVYWEGDEDDLEESLSEINDDPDLDFILGRSSLMNLAQKKLVVQALHKRLLAITDFDPSILANELVELQGTPKFDQYVIPAEYEEEEDEYDFTAFFDKHKLTKEQRQMVSEFFYEQITGDYEEDDDNVVRYSHNKESDIMKQAFTSQSMLFIFFKLIIAIAFIGVLPFFVPNFLQSKGWLSADTGWGFKIFIGILTAVVSIIMYNKIFGWVLQRKIDNIKKNQN